MYSAAIPRRCLLFLWHAPRGLDGGALLVFAVAMLIAVRSRWPPTKNPSTALGPELAPDYDQRTKLLLPLVLRHRGHR